MLSFREKLAKGIFEHSTPATFIPKKSKFLQPAKIIYWYEFTCVI